jgi:hypothetical protein
LHFCLQRTKEVEETEEVGKKDEKTASKIGVVEKATVPEIELQDEFCPNESYETKSNTTLSYCAAAAPSRKLAGFDYYLYLD